MRKEYCEYVKKCVHEYIARVHLGKVSLSEVYRLFSDYGSLGDLEKCLDGFVKDGMAKKEAGPEGRLYVFRGMALEFGKRWMEELKDLQLQAEKLKQEISSLKSNLQVIEEVRDIWQSGWEKVCEDEQTYASLKNYVSSVFWGNYVKSRLELLQSNDAELKAIKDKIVEIQSRLEASYEGAIDRSSVSKK